MLSYLRDCRLYADAGNALVEFRLYQDGGVDQLLSNELVVARRFAQSQGWKLTVEVDDEGGTRQVDIATVVWHVVKEVTAEHPDAEMTTEVPPSNVV